MLGGCTLQCISALYNAKPLGLAVSNSWIYSPGKLMGLGTCSPVAQVFLDAVQ